jgi:hypothetical protein
MTYMRKNYMTILLFILWIGLSASVTTAHADANELRPVNLSDKEIRADIDFLGALSDPIAARLDSLVPTVVPSGLPVED